MGVNGIANETNNFTVATTTSDPSPLKVVTDVVMTTALVIIMLGMGSAIEIKELWKHLRRPVGPAIGMAAQFVVLPLVTFGFAHALQLDSMAAIGMLIMGCCPGGSTSNVFSYWVDGDVPLSLTMTSLATALALGMMPLNVWLYSRSWTDADMVIPYAKIIVSLVMVVVPAAVGIGIRWKWKSIALKVVKTLVISYFNFLAGSYCGALAVVLTMTLMSVLYPFMYKASWKIYVASFFLPFLGFAFGYIVAKLCRMDNKMSRTVALETGIQNFPLCMTLISISFPKSEIPYLALCPLLYGVFVLTNSCLFVAGYRVCRRLQGAYKGHKDEYKSVPIVNNKDKVAETSDMTHN